MNINFVIQPYVILLAGTIYSSVYGREIRICTGKSEKIECRRRKVISIRKAFYGRDRSWLCIDKGDLDKHKCGTKNNALIEVSKRCSNRQTCSLQVDDTIFKSDCPKDSAYLVVNYRCVRESKVCRRNRFQCFSNRKCISNKKVCDDKMDCPDGSDESDCGTKETCGIQEIQPGFITQHCPTLEQARLVGGCAAIPHSWPWTLQLRNNRSIEDTDHKCGAVLISPSFAITATHCFIFTPIPSWWQVVAGRHQTDIPGENEQIRKISKIITFPNPTGNPLDRDITLIKFDRPFDLTKYVTTVCLPTREPKPGDDCAIAGWGVTRGTGNEGVLKQTLMPIVDRDLCNKTEGLVGNITEYMICAGFKHGVHDACNEDSGGPLMCKIEDRYHVEGIISWGNDCGQPNQPGVYVNVFKVVDWIKEQMLTN